MDREVASHLAFDLSLGARLSLERMVGTEPLVRPMRLLEWGLFMLGRGCLKRHLLLDSNFFVRIDSGDGSGQFIRRKFST